MGVFYRDSIPLLGRSWGHSMFVNKGDIYGYYMGYRGDHPTEPPSIPYSEPVSKESGRPRFKIGDGIPKPFPPTVNPQLYNLNQIMLLAAIKESRYPITHNTPLH